MPSAAHAQNALTTCNPRENRADFDGDCKTDISTFSRGTGYWTSVASSNSNYVSFQFGQSGDIAAPGDYDGDGKADVAVQRPSNGRWYIVSSATGNTSEVLFVNAEFPVPGDT